MKVRLDFVTNSSSSSFICTVCGEEASGMDLSLSDAEMFRCVNGHTICDSHSDESMDDKNPKDIMISHYEDEIRKYEEKVKEKPEDKDYKDWLEEAKKNLERVKNTEDEDELEDEASDVKADARYEMPSEFCPVCQFKEIDKKEAYKYFMKKLGLSKENFLNEIKSKYNNYNDYQKDIK